MKPSQVSRPSSSKKLPLKFNAFEKRVLAFGTEQTLWHKNDTLVLALSGGADSTALLHIFLTLAHKENFRLVIAHVNYGLRGTESSGDASFVEGLATKYSLPFHLLTVKKTDRKKDEASLRAIRYDFFSQVLKKEKATAVVLGHHKDDQAETFLLRLLRGSGATGLQAMQPKRDFYIHPFLFATRKEIRHYLTSKSIPFRNDSSNIDTRYLRNKIRHELIPLLENDYQSNITNILADTALRLSETPVASLKTLSLSVLEKKNSLTFSLAELLALPSSTRLVFLRSILSELLPYPISQSLSREIEKALKSTKNKVSQVSFRGLKITKKGATVTLQKISLD